MEDSIKTKSQLMSENSELRRIEQYLRAEVAELWSHIKNIESMPFYNLWIKIASKLTYRKKTKSTTIQKQETETTPELGHEPQNCDYLFIYSSDSQEIGGLKTSGKLAKDLINLKAWSIKGLALQHNPTQLNHDGFFINENSLKASSTIEIVVACGSDTIEKAFKISRKYQAKLVLLMMGLDHIFAPTWQESKNFLSAIKQADLVLCLAPHLVKQANIYGARRVALATLGFDEREFSFSGIQKTNKILVSCRGSVEKGLKIVLPSLELLKSRGWKIVGFGDLVDHESAEVFDEFLGRLSPEQISFELQDTKFLIDPSWIEGLGLVALEAAACGVRPIITKRGDYRDLFQEGLEPFLEVVNFIDPTNLLECLILAEDQLLPEEVARRVSHLTWNKGVLQAAAALNELKVS
jgi:glycosyltransferase involved in cell wall biosynthesis